MKNKRDMIVKVKAGERILFVARGKIKLGDFLLLDATGSAVRRGRRKAIPFAIASENGVKGDRLRGHALYDLRLDRRKINDET